MAKRYYLCDVIGDGSAESPFRPVIADHGVNYVGEIDAYKTKAFVLVNAVNHTSLINIAGVDALPNFPLDAKINAMQSQAKNGLINAMDRRGFATGLISSADGYRDVIRGIGRELNPNFDENNFDVAE